MGVGIQANRTEKGWNDEDAGDTYTDGSHLTYVQGKAEKEETRFEKVETGKQKEERETEKREEENGSGTGCMMDDDELEEEEKEKEKGIDQSHCALLLL